MGIVIMNGVEYASAPKDGFPPIIYSDEEREIGVWRDGKPLYQKCINLGTLEYDAGDYHYVNHNISNIDKIVECMGICSASDNQFIQIPSMRNSTTYGITLSATASAIRYSNNWITSSGWTFVILQYTKTTDTPGSGKYTTYGGLAHHYSENEQVVGTWIDGKPLYEKTIYIASVTSGSSYQHNISNVKDISIYEIRAKRNTGWYSSGHIFQDGINNITESFTIIPSSTVLYAYLFGNTITDCYVTVRYTKTTD